MRTGQLIRIILVLIVSGWRKQSLSSHMKLRDGLLSLIAEEHPSLPSPSQELPSVYASEPVTEAQPWVTATATVQVVTRIGMDDMYIGGVNDNYAAFYELHHLAAWFVDHGIDDNDPVWTHLDQLAITENNG
jgi:hypothetical protein